MNLPEVLFPIGRIIACLATTVATVYVSWLLWAHDGHPLLAVCVGAIIFRQAVELLVPV